MKRINEIISDGRRRYPRDDFFTNFEESFQIFPEIRYYYRLYDKALMNLDDESWKILKEKALRHFMDYRKGQRKQGFFNQLNEAFAYQYLMKNNYKDVRFIKEGKKISPDIRFIFNDTWSYCEVKTLGISDDEIDRRSSREVYDGRIYIELSNGFLNKFAKAVVMAMKQIQAWGPNGLVYIIIKFDDFTGYHYQNYKKQLIKFSQDRGFKNLFIKIGLRGNETISHKLLLPRIADKTDS